MVEGMGIEMDMMLDLFVVVQKGNEKELLLAVNMGLWWDDIEAENWESKKELQWDFVMAVSMAM